MADAEAEAAGGDTATLHCPATPEELPASRLILLFTDENKYRMKLP